MGRDIKPLVPVNPEGLDEIAEELLNETSNGGTDPDSTDEISKLIVANPRGYIEIPNTGTVIALTEAHKGKDMFNTLDALVSEELKMPSIARFMQHWTNVKEAAQGRTKLLYADGSQVSNDVTQDLWGRLSSGHNDGCWTWLDALFKEDKGQRYLVTDLKVKPNKTLEGNAVKLNVPVGEDCYVALSFNEQGFPTTKSASGSYQQGQNIYFYQPRNERVAWFSADSVRALLDCDRGPSYTDSSLGVFASGRSPRSAPKNLGGKK